MAKEEAKTIRITPIRHGRLIEGQHVAPGQIVEIARKDASYLLGAELVRECDDDEVSVDPVDDVVAIDAQIKRLQAQRAAAVASAPPKAPTGAKAPTAKNDDKTPAATR